KRHELAAFDLVGNGLSLVTIANDVAIQTGNVGISADVEHDHLTFSREVFAELLPGHIVLHPEGLAHDELLDLCVAEGLGAFLSEVGYGHSSRRILAGVC